MARIFLAGASGIIGQRLIPLLRRAGHLVTGTTRTEARTGLLRALAAQHSGSSRATSATSSGARYVSGAGPEARRSNAARVSEWCVPGNMSMSWSVRSLKPAATSRAESPASAPASQAT